MGKFWSRYLPLSTTPGPSSLRRGSNMWLSLSTPRPIGRGRGRVFLLYREGPGEGLLLTNSSIIVKVMSSLSGNVSRTLLILNRPILIIRS